MMARGRIWAVLLVLAAGALAACDTAMYPADGQGTGLPPNSGVTRSFSGATLKTFTVPLSQVGTATLQSLNYMDIDLAEVNKAAQTWDIFATAGTRHIDIHLEAMTPKTTLMRVTVGQADSLFNDGATATEIVLQTADALHERVMPQTAQRPARARAARAAQGL